MLYDHLAVCIAMMALAVIGHIAFSTYFILFIDKRNLTWSFKH